MEIFIKILQFILSFSLLVVVHEFGHFIFARMFGVRVEQFQLFFGKPWVTYTTKRTRYGIGWIPFGGFVKLAGMIDESVDTEQMKSEPKPDEFRSKPAWQRLLIMIGGVLMNVILAFLIYVGMSYKYGENFLSTDDMKYGYVFSEQAQELGFRNGDLILSVNGERFDDFRQLRIALLVNQNYTVETLRGGDTVSFSTPEVSVMRLAQDPFFISPRYPFLIGDVVEAGGAERAGIRSGDRLVSLNGEPMQYFDEFTQQFTTLGDSTATVGVARDSSGVETVKVLPVEVSPEGKIGVAVDMLAVTPVHTKEYTLMQSIAAGFNRLGDEIGGYWKQLKLIFKPKTEAFKSIGGPIAIGGIFPDTWNWPAFWEITALLSVVLAVMNILPIPALDGGHVLFLLVEIITGRKPGDKFLLYAQIVGLVLLFSLIIFATGNDIARLFTK